MHFHQHSRNPNNHQREQQRTAQSRHSYAQEIRIMESYKPLNGIPSIRNHITSQCNRSGRFDDREPVSLVHDISQIIEDTHHKERNGIAYE